MRRRIELLLIVVVLAGVAALAVSLIAGLLDRGPRAVRPGEAASTTAADPGIEVEVLNGGGRSGVARRATGRLRELGFDVVYYGNAGRFDWEQSVVLDRVGRMDQARRVARALGVERVESRPDSTLLLDVTVILGRDWPPARARGREAGGNRFGRLWRRLTGAAEPER